MTSSPQDNTDSRTKQGEAEKHPPSAAIGASELQTIFQNAPFLIMVVDEERRIQIINNFGASLVNQEPDDLAGLRGGEALRCVNALDNPEGCGFGPACENCTVRKTVLNTLEHGKNHEDVEAYMRFRGSEGPIDRTLRLYTTPLTFSGKRHVMVIAQDITDLKESEKAVKESEERFRTLFANLQDGVFVHRLLPDNQLGFFEEVNDAACTMLGYSVEEFKQMTPYDLDDADTSSAYIPEAIQKLQKNGSAAFEAVHVTKSGDRIPVEINANTIERHEACYVLSVVRNISDRKRAENELRRSEELLRTSLDGLSANIAVLDESGQIIAVNQAWRNFAEQNGLFPEKVSEGTNYLEVCDRASEGEESAREFADAIRRILAGDEAFFAQEYPCHSPDQNRWFIGRISGCSDQYSRRVVLAHEDITERKEAEETLRRSHEELEKNVAERTVQLAKANEELEHRLGLQQVIAQVSRRLMEISGTVIDDAVNDALEMVGESVSVDRCYLFLLHSNGEAFSNTHEWCANGIHSQQAELQELPVNQYKWLFEQLRNGETLHVPDTTELPEEAANFQKALFSGNISSVLNMPVFSENGLRGFIGFDAVCSQKTWSESEILVLETFARLLARAMDQADHVNALEHATEQWRTTFDGISEPVCLLAPDHRIVRCNEAMCSMLGRAHSEINGQKCYELICSHDGPPAECILTRALQSGQRTENVVAHGNQWYHVTVDPTFDPEGTIAGAVHVMRDITLQKQAEERRERVARAQRLRGVIANAALHATDETELLNEICSAIIQEGGYRFVWIGYAENDQQKKVRPVAQAGYEKGYLETLTITWADSEHGMGPTGTAIRTGKPQVAHDLSTDTAFSPWREAATERGYASSAAIPLTLNEESSQADGAINLYATEPEAFSQEEVALLTQSASDLGFGIRLLRSRAAERQAAKARDEALEELEQQRVVSMRTDRLRSLGEMAAGIAHELNQPLVGVRGLAEHLLLAMKRGWDIDSERMREKLQSIVEQADRMTNVIQHVRTFSREAGSSETQPIDLNDVVESALELLEVQLRSHGLEVVRNLDTSLPHVIANPFSLEEVILNCLINARDAVEERAEEISDEELPQKITVHTRVEEKDKAKWLILEIEDTGSGIPEDQLQTVFEPFFTTKGPDRGTGLGLSISRSIVENFGGTMALVSETKVGTTVKITLPAGE